MHDINYLISKCIADDDTSSGVASLADSDSMEGWGESAPLAPSSEQPGDEFTTIQDSCSLLQADNKQPTATNPLQDEPSLVRIARPLHFVTEKMTAVSLH